MYTAAQYTNGIIVSLYKLIMQETNLQSEAVSNSFKRVLDKHGLSLK
jgi:hypothetical protein